MRYMYTHGIWCHFAHAQLWTHLFLHYPAENKFAQPCIIPCKLISSGRAIDVKHEKRRFYNNVQ